MAVMSKRSPILFLLLLLSACVTINVYFPAAAAENAADRLIQEVYGLEKPDTEAAPAPESAPKEKSGAWRWIDNSAIAFMDFFVPVAMAQQADINVSTPAINAIKSAMTQRHRQLQAFYGSGAVGMDSNGLIQVRDAKAVDLKQRNQVKKLVNDENRDRNALYNEIAIANGHPEWEGEIRKTFARRWVANAPSGWWYQTANGWTQTK